MRQPKASAEALQLKTSAPMGSLKHSDVRHIYIRPPVGKYQKSTHKGLVIRRRVDRALAVKTEYTEVNLHAISF